MHLRPVDPKSSTPPFEQVRSQVAAQIASGRLSAGTRLPTVRALAAEVGLAVNTVARVYKELEADGVVVTEGRRGTFVRPGAASGGDEASAAAEEYVATCRRLGVTGADAIRLVEQHWSP